MKTTTVRPLGNATLLIDRAFRRYASRYGSNADQASSYNSGIVTHEGKDYVFLNNCNKVLAVYAITPNETLREIEHPTQELIDADDKPSFNDDDEYKDFINGAAKDYFHRFGKDATYPTNQEVIDDLSFEHWDRMRRQGPAPLAYQGESYVLLTTPDRLLAAYNIKTDGTVSYVENPAKDITDWFEPMTAEQCEDCIVAAG